MTETPIKRIAAIHDLSCFGKCSLTVAIPVLSAMGLEVCPLPTALLSTHTGGFQDFSFLDLSEEIEKIKAHWESLSLSFDGIYTGFLGSGRQIGSVLDFIARFKREGTLVVVDPVMGDNGKVYSTYTPDMVEGMKSLVKCADIITPNLTEGCILTGKKYAPSFPDEELHEMLFALCREGPEMAVITGIEEAGMAKVVGFSQSENQIYEVRNPMVGKHYPGTGDIYASVLTGSLLSGEKLPRAMGRASYFNYHAIRETHRLGTPPREGVALEKMLSLLLENGAFFDAAKMSAGR